jgi:hypothetical protein
MGARTAIVIRAVAVTFGIVGAWYCLVGFASIIAAVVLERSTLLKDGNLPPLFSKLPLNLLGTGATYMAVGLLAVGGCRGLLRFRRWARVYCLILSTLIPLFSVLAYARYCQVSRYLNNLGEPARRGFPLLASLMMMLGLASWIVLNRFDVKEHLSRGTMPVTGEGQLAGRYDTDD